ECSEEVVVAVTDLSEDPNPDFDVEHWTWVLTYGDSLLLSDVQNPQFVINGSQEDVTLSVVVTSGNGCTAEMSATFDVNIIAIPFKGDSVGVCDGDTVALFDSPGPGLTYTWAPTESLDLTDPAFPLAFPDETTTYSVTVTDGLCTVTGEVVVVVQELPNLDFVVDTDCKSLEIAITNMSDGFQYHWDFGDGDTSLAENPVHTYDSAGVYTIVLTSADGCDVQTSQEITVSVIDEEIEDESISCFMEPVVLNPDGSAEYSYQWTPAGFLDDSSAISPVASVTETTTFFVTITDIDLPGCSIVDSVAVIVPGDFSLAAPPDSSYCDAPEVTLTAGNDALEYVWKDMDGNILAEGPDLTVQPQDTTSYVLCGTDSFGCTKSDTVTLNPTFFAVEVGPDVTICPGDDTTIFVMNVDPNQDLSYVWLPVDCVIGDNTVPNPRVKADEDKVFTVQITNNDLGCMVERQVEVRVSLFNYEITPESVICLGESLELNIVNQDTTTLEYMWTPVESILDGANTDSPTVMPDETTTYVVKILNTTYGCETLDSVTVIVSWFDPDILEIFVDKDSIILNDDVFVISTNQDPDLDFQWSGPGDYNPNDPIITVTPTSEGPAVYSVTVTNADGCQLTGMTPTLTVLDPLCNMEDIFVPNGFSPNGDGQNDVLFVYGNFIETMELRIFNRWGEEVFQSFDQNIGWDGRFEGKELSPDVFGYYLRVTCPPDKSYFMKGNITLLR
ncbi:MAG: gliding motility-associated C-terminal domain-containing protein, partial [Saprospiraceae bacterium]|nr:gliding motility-associated C-terminal domain-containing protein [Saprospiraceae bacterium]